MCASGSGRQRVAQNAPFLCFPFSFWFLLLLFCSQQLFDFDSARLGKRDKIFSSILFFICMFCGINNLREFQKIRFFVLFFFCFTWICKKH